MKKSQPVLVTMSILAALQFLAGGAALGEVIGVQAFGLFVLAIGAVQAGVQFWVQSQTVPYRDALAYIDSDGNPVAGPAGPIPNGQSVEVISTPPDTTGRRGTR